MPKANQISTGTGIELLNMTLHLGILQRGHHEWKRTDGNGEVTHWIFLPEDGKIPNPAHQNKLEPTHEESYFQVTRRVLREIYEEEPELFEDDLVILYQCGLKGANNGCRDAIEAEGFEHLCAVFDEASGEYNLQAKGTLHRSQTPLWKSIQDARPVVPLASLRSTTPSGFN